MAHHPLNERLNSLNFEVPESALHEKKQAQLTSTHTVTYLSLKWILALILGIVLSVISFCVNLGVENISGVKFRAASLLLHRHGPWAAYSVLAAVNLMLMLLSAVITTYYAPAAAGSGIPETKAFLNGVAVPHLFVLRALIAKIVGVTFVVAASMPLGKEGPFVHIGASVASLLVDTCAHDGPVTPSTSGFRKAWQAFANDRDRRDLVTAGSAGGVAGAFRSPIGGLLFALEELATSWRPHLLWRCFATCAVCVFVARFLTNICNEGGCGFSARGAFVIYEITDPQTDFFITEVLPMLIIGLVGGLLGAMFIRLNEAIAAWRRDKVQTKLARVGEAVLAAAVVTTLSFLLPFSADCRPCPDTATEPGSSSHHRPCPSDEGLFVQQHCPPGHYNDLAILLFSTQDDAIRALFSSGTEKHFSYRSLLVFLCYYILSFAWTFGMAFPAGSLVPSIVGGAAFGRLVGRFAVRGPSAHSGGSHIDASTYALLGSASLLAGVMRSTASLCVILLEVTNNLQLLPMLMLVVLISKGVADVTGIEGLFERSIASKGLPFLDVSPPRVYNTHRAGDVASEPAVCLPRVVQVKDLVDTLTSTTHNAFPVIDTASPSDEDGRVLGMALRADILALLSPDEPVGLTDEETDATALLEKLPLITEDVLDKYVDLQPLVNPAHTIAENASLVRTFNLFTKLQLRHLLVVSSDLRQSQLRGVLTRKDLHPLRVQDRASLRARTNIRVEVPSTV